MTYRNPATGETYDLGNGQPPMSPKVELTVRALRGDPEARRLLGIPPKPEHAKSPLRTTEAPEILPTRIS